MRNQKNVLRHSVLSTELTLMAPTGLLQNIIRSLHLYIGHGHASELVTSWENHDISTIHHTKTKKLQAAIYSYITSPTT